VGLGSLLLFAAGLVVIGFGLADTNIWFTLVGIAALALPILRWFRIKRENDGTWTFEGAMEKPPDDVSRSESREEQPRRRSGR
jgi:LPXTG-motif cell wall-anchored protein